MGTHKVRKGLRLPAGTPPQGPVEDARSVAEVALVGRDYIGMKPRMLVQVGDRVKCGTPVMEDRKNPGVQLTAPASGVVAAIHRGPKRRFESLVIRREGDECEALTPPSAGDGDALRQGLIASGLWTAFRARPFSRTPAVDDQPAAIFVTAMDSQPGAPNLAIVTEGRAEDIEAGLGALVSLAPKVFVCRAPGSTVGGAVAKVQYETFDGPHPAGTAGYHIHALLPVSRSRTVWHLHVEDVARIGHFVRTGKLHNETVVSIAGPAAPRPRHARTLLGAQLSGLSLEAKKEHRIISGSLLHGDEAAGEVLGFLGRYHHQVSLLEEDRSRTLLGWTRPAPHRFTTMPALSRLLGRARLTTNTNGSRRAMVPIGLYERVMPFDMIPTLLLRALSVQDVEWAEELGVLELDEEDLATCTFVCPGKLDYGAMLRETLDTIWKEG